MVLSCRRDAHFCQKKEKQMKEKKNNQLMLMMLMMMLLVMMMLVVLMGTRFPNSIYTNSRSSASAAVTGSNNASGF